MNISYQYRITYENGKSCGNRKSFFFNINVSKENYIKIIQGLLEGIPIEEIGGIPEVIEEMKENARENDAYFNLDGSLRKTKLKKPRAIKSIDLYIPESEYSRFRKMKDPVEAINRKEEHMTIYRGDGTYMQFSSENGRVTIVDSRNKIKKILDADYFLSLVGS